MLFLYFWLCLYVENKGEKKRKIDFERVMGESFVV